MNNALIVLNNITKNYGQNQILSKVDLTIEEGQSIALVGHNGSGKSTLLKLICGLTTITSGELKYAKKIKFNYVPELFPKMNITVKQYIHHMGLIEGLSKQTINEKSQKLFQTFYMENMVETSMKNLSKGSLQKVAVIQSLLSCPDVLLLDEPLSGQDMQSQQNFIKMINDLKNQGVTIIMSCHEMFLVNRISNIAYEIKDKKLEPYEINKTDKYEFDVLYFDNNGNQIDTTIRNLIDDINYSQDKIKLIVSRDHSNKIICKMINDGFILRTMKGIDE